jgi:hypothetical protein
MSSFYYGISDKFYVSFFPKDVACMRNTGNGENEGGKKTQREETACKTSRSTKDDIKNNHKSIKCEVMFGAI